MILDKVKHKLITVGSPNLNKPIFAAISVGAHFRIANARDLFFNSLNRYWKDDYFWVVGSGNAPTPPLFKNGYVLEVDLQDLNAISKYTDKVMFTLKTLAPFFIEPRDLVYADLDCLFLRDISHRIKQDKLTITREGLTTGPINGGLFICPGSRWEDLKFWHEQNVSNLNKTDQRILKWLIGLNKIEVNTIDDMVYYPWCMRDANLAPIMSDNHEWKQYEVLHFNTKTWRWRLRAMNWYWQEWLKETA